MINATHTEVSVVVPVYCEAPNVGPLAEEICAALEPLGRAYELIFVDDGSPDDTAAACKAIRGVRTLRHPKNLGQSAATLTGIHAARGETIVTLDGDGQNDPAAIPELLRALETNDVAVGYRQKREDTFSRRFASRLAYRVRNLVLRDRIVDIGCSLRAFPREDALALPAFDGYHRLLPALFVFRGLSVAQLPTLHRPRVAGISKYTNLRRGTRGLFDLVGLFWLKRRMLRRSEAVVVESTGRELEASDGPSNEESSPHVSQSLARATALSRPPAS